MQIIKRAGLIFECDGDIEVMRAQMLLTKEPGTIAWLENHLRSEDVFWDVGANIGVYSLFAVRCGAEVCAFEPHLATAQSLLRNVRVNGMQLGVKVLSTPLGDRDGWQQFVYASDTAGASGSQLGPALDEYGKPFQPVACELKWAVRGDSFAKDTGFYPDLVKIDVDGLELAVLEGMAGILATPRLRALQVEIHEHTDTDIGAFIAASGFRLDHRHHTSRGQKMIAKGADQLTVPHNAVFVR
jgi:FkbM family methyltransferase